MLGENIRKHISYKEFESRVYKEVLKLKGKNINN